MESQRGGEGELLNNQRENNMAITISTGRTSTASPIGWTWKKEKGKIANGECPLSEKQIAEGKKTDPFENSAIGDEVAPVKLPTE